MAITMATPGVDGLGPAVEKLRQWQHDEAAPQLHPGDLGWFWRYGTPATAAALRTWSRDGVLVALGLRNSATELRLAIEPRAQRDEELARRLIADATKPDHGLFAAGTARIDAPGDAVIQDLLSEDGWAYGEPWRPLSRDLTTPVPEPGVRIEVTGPQRAHVRTALQRASFDGSTFTDERWHAMAAGLPYADGRCLVAYDDHGDAVAATTVWSAGPGRPGLVEPMGVHQDHRGRGYGTAVSVAAACALRELGSSTAFVCTPSSNVAAVATYRAAGFHELPEVRDRIREAR